MVAAGWIDRDGNPADPTFKSPAQGRQRRSGRDVAPARRPRRSLLRGLRCRAAERHGGSDPGGGEALRHRRSDRPAPVGSLGGNDRDRPGTVGLNGRMAVVRLEGETSNALFDTLAEWNDHLKHSDLKGYDEPTP